MAKKTHPLDEFKLINFIKKHNTRPSKCHNVVADIGDDCFVYNSHTNAKYVVTTDILIDNIHFKTAWATPEQIGQKSIEVNVSDIASMGKAKPLYAFISVGIPKNISDKFIKKLFSSIKKTCDKYDIHLSGGDTVGADFLTISVTLIGIAYDKVITRTGAKKGDLIFVSGTFGDSGAGLEIMHNVQCTMYNKRQNREIPHQVRNDNFSFCHTVLDAVSHRFSASQLLSFSANERRLVKKHLVPQARLKLANNLSKNLKITSMTDSSDGLFKSIELLAGEKGADININSIPISKNLIKYCGTDLNKLYKFALFGGEEFELVFTVDKKDSAKAKKFFPEIKCVGTITGYKKIKYFYNNKLKNIKYDGYKHF
ncbi:MAG: thiamine-monophosphate kinase [Elusimicrobia bacterium]|nr:thiamine-monophosphate kinase [Elusimicrobiota bacterium]